MTFMTRCQQFSLRSVEDMQGALSSLGRSRAFAVPIIMAVAFTTAVIVPVVTRADLILWRPLPYDLDGKLVRITSIRESDPSASSGVSLPDLKDWQNSVTTLDAIGAYAPGSLTILEKGEQLRVGYVSSDFMKAVGAKLILGQFWRDSDVTAGRPKIVLLEEAEWRRSFAGEPGIVGHLLTTPNGPVEVIGVVESPSLFARSVAAWQPLSDAGNRAQRTFWAVGRLRPGVSPERADSELRQICTQLAAEYPATDGGWSARAMSLRNFTTKPLRSQLGLFLMTAAALWLVMSLNVAGVCLVRCTRRANEFGIRNAIGATPARLRAQVLMEHVYLSVFGGAAGLVGSLWLSPFINAGMPTLLPIADLHLDARIAAMTIMLCAVTGLLIGVAAASVISRYAGSGALRSTSSRSSALSRHLASTLVALEVALSIVLLVASGLLIRTALHLSAVDPGFDTQHTAAINVVPLQPPIKGQAAGANPIMSGVSSLAGIPGIEAIAATDSPPFGDVTGFVIGIDSGRRISLTVHSVTAGYFSTMGMPIRKGRDIGRDDIGGAPLVMVVSEKTAVRLWGTVSPLGRTLRLMGAWAEGKPHSVIGVVADVHHRALDHSPLDEVYVPIAQRPTSDVTFVVRAQNVAATLPDAMARLRQLPTPVIIKSATLFRDVVDASMVDQRHRALLVSVATVGLLFYVALGIFGVTAYVTTQRSYDVAIRLALGGTRHRILVSTVGTICLGAVVGIAAGIAVALSTGHLLAAMLFDLEPSDPLTLGLGVVVMGLVVVSAASVPIRRLIAMDPAVTLRI